MRAPGGPPCGPGETVVRETAARLAWPRSICVSGAPVPIVLSLGCASLKAVARTANFGPGLVVPSIRMTCEALLTLRRGLDVRIVA